MDHESSPAERGLRRGMPVSFSLETRLTIEALATMHQQPTSAVLETAVLSYVSTLPDADRKLIESLANRARQSLASRVGSSSGNVLSASNTVSGKRFTYKGSVDGELEIQFENSQPLRITRESIDRIREEIIRRKGPAMMGAIFSPLMPNSIGKAIYEKYKLSPINLSYVIPLLQERREVRAFKEGRNWFVEALNAATRH